ncbi:hypothetical protein DID96_00810 [Burkholderia sp. Bp8963]|uniref:hypothetical protein n=1 Tax=Burkholderia sp. Bp8963 TaxID=2184547 RepID=UPI000F5A9763|nr:hypothetical protein [Burkholderia sp. Bp8963]RQS76850.1 hypothetical protein DID96_00810 [Burkholderia sp. Bp8963]
MSYGTFPNDDGKRRASRQQHTAAEAAHAADAAARDDLDALLALARQAGLLVTLDGQIGREKYQSIAGSVAALQRFAAALRQQMLTAAPAPAPAVPRRAARGGRPRVNRGRRFSPCRNCPLENVRHHIRSRHGVRQRRLARPACAT